jgi:hypothetical protein
MNEGKRLNSCRKGALFLLPAKMDSHLTGIGVICTKQKLKRWIGESEETSSKTS